jgi:prepilin-type N-terminal cleavage/methylation domain-containing protein
MKTGRHRSSRGFTLIEVMVALSLLGLVVAAIYSSWTAVLRGSKIGLEAAATAQRQRIAVQVMQEALASVRYFTANWQWYYFVAENGSQPALSFVARLPQSFPRSGRFGDHDVRRVTFTLEAGKYGDKQLVMRQVPLLLEMDKDEQEFPLVLAENVKELSFKFWDAQKKKWVEDWLDPSGVLLTNQLPKSVEITLTLGVTSSHSYARHSVSEWTVTRVVSIPSAGVLPQWQMPGAPPMPVGPPGTPPGQPGQPGMQPPGQLVIPPPGPRR